MPFDTLDDCAVRGKRVLVRVDINSPLDRQTLRVKDRSKIASAVPTLRELSDKGAKLVVLAHQGRSGSWDFVSLSEHAEILSELLERAVRYVDDLLGKAASEAIGGLSEGDIVLLKNVRSYEGETKKLTAEEHARGDLVSTLAPMFDIFVNDAFASAHRPQASIIGFAHVLPSYAGRLMEKEYTTLSRITESPERPCVFVFGGTKFSDSLPIVRHILDRGITDRVILGGLIGLAYAAAAGKDIGDPNRAILADELASENIQEANEILNRFGQSILLPIDAALDDQGKRTEADIGPEPLPLPACDIGSKSIGEFGAILGRAKTIFISGPVGVFERPEFALGTRALFEKSTSSGAFCIIGGGHTTAAANQMSFAKKISYVSTGGGALEHFLLGRPLPAFEALKRSAEKRR